MWLLSPPRSSSALRFHATLAATPAAAVAEAKAPPQDMQNQLLPARLNERRLSALL